jgi:urease accessory protein UreF
MQQATPQSGQSDPAGTRERLLNAAEDGDWRALSSWNAWFRASRETAESGSPREKANPALVVAMASAAVTPTNTAAMAKCLSMMRLRPMK